MTAPDKVFRFYDFEFSTRRRELRKSGHRVRMSASQIRLLTLFLERHGDLVTREEVVGRIWTDTATIDVAGGVNTAIKRLRENLGDDSASPRFLETVIGLGYRFIAPVEIVDEVQAVAEVASSEALAAEASDPESPAPETPEETKLAAHRPRPVSRYWIPLAACLLFILAGLVALPHLRRKTVVPSQEADHNGNVFIRATSNRAGKKISAAAISPDGTFLAYADSSGIRVEKLATGQLAVLAITPASEVNHIAWFPNQLELVVSGLDAATKRKTVWLVPLTGLYTSVMATNADLATVSPDSSTIAFTKTEGAEVWVAGLNGMNPRRLAAAETGNVFSFLLWSADSRRLMLASHDGETDPGHTEPQDPGRPVIPESANSANASRQNHWIWGSVDAATGKLLAQQDNIRIDSAVLSPDGKLRYVTGASPETSLVQRKIFSVQTDSLTGRFLGTPADENDENSVQADSISAISASRDGSRIAIIGSAQTGDVFTATLHRDRPESMPALVNIRALTSDIDTSYPHAWTPDGRIIYESGYEGRLAIFGRSIQDTSSTLVAQLPGQGAALAQVSPDGKWILFLGLAPTSTSVYRISTGGGTPEPIPGTTGVQEIRCARTGPIACVLHKTENEGDARERMYFALDPVSGVGKLLAHTPWEPARHGDWGLSPDGSTIVVATHDPLHPALNFLTLNGATKYEKTLPLQGHGAPLGVNWTTDGKALFVETRTVSSFELLYVTLNGQVQVLRKSPSLIWAIPSPDGTQMAFPDYTTNTNVWVSGMQGKSP